MSELINCPVCNSLCFPLDVVDFNKSCEESRGYFITLAEIPVYYFLCHTCQFCFAPMFAKWGKSDFEEKIYNKDYILVDPDYIEVRPRSNAASLIKMFSNGFEDIRHLDYGGGNGLMSQILCESGWQSTSYDPFNGEPDEPSRLGKFDLITAYEIFEHVADVQGLAENLSALSTSNGIILFSTLISDGNISPRRRITWWYASPRNGHISLFSKKSLAKLATQQGFRFGSFSNGFHAFWRTVPPWASHLIC